VRKLVRNVFTASCLGFITHFQEKQNIGADYFQFHGKTKRDKLFPNFTDVGNSFL
jgi:hypothetical protein